MSNVHRQMQLGFLVMPTALAVQMAATLLVAQQLGTASFGVFSVVFATMTVANFIAELGLGTIVTKLVAEGRRPPADHLALALPIIMAFSLLAAAVQLIVVWLAYTDVEARWAGAIASLNSLIFGSSMALSCTLRGLGQMGRWMFGFLAQKVLFLLFVVVLPFALGKTVAVPIAAWTLSNFLNLLFYAATLWGGVWRGQLRWNRSEAWALVTASVPVGLTTAANQLGQNLDTFILAALLSSHDVGVYALGQRLLNPVRNILHGAVSTPTFPGLCRLATTDRAEFSRQSGQLCLIQWLAGLILSVGAVVAAPLAVPWLLPKFDESIPVIAITVWSLAPACLSLQLRYSYTAISRQSAFLGFNAAYLGLKVVIIAGLTWQLGILGACYGTVLAELVFAVLTWLGLSSARATLRFAGRIALPTGAAALATLLFVKLGVRNLLTLVLTAAYLGISVFFLNRMLRAVRGRAPVREAVDARLSGDVVAD